MHRTTGIIQSPDIVRPLANPIRMYVQKMIAISDNKLSDGFDISESKRVQEPYCS